MSHGNFCEIILDLETDLSRMKDVSEKLPEQIENAIGLCMIALGRMHELVIKEGFPDKKNRKSTFSKRSNLLYTVSYFTIRQFLIWKVNCNRPMSP